jgi:protein CpxP
MRKTICTIALSGLLTFGMAGISAFAQDAPPPPSSQDAPPPHGGRMMNSEQQLEHLTKKLSLSADQQSQIKPMLDSRNQQMQALMQDQSVPRPDRHAKMISIQDDTKAKIEAVLNDDQKQKFDAMQAEMMQRRQQHMQNQQSPDAQQPAQPAPQQ